MRESQVPAAGGDDNQVHNHEHGLVTPAVGPRFSPEAGAPSKYFLLHRAEHDQNQTNGGELCENARNYSEAASQLCCTQKNCEALAHPNVLASRCRVFQMFVAARDEHHANYHTQEQQRDIAQLS